MTPLGVRRNFLISLGNRNLSDTLGFLHSFYIWDSKAVFLVVVGNLDKQKKIVINNYYHRNSFKAPYVLVEQIFLNASLQSMTEVY